MSRGSAFRIEHLYSIENSNNDKVNISVYFFVNQDYTVKETNTESLNGETGIVTGNVYWKYNNFVGNRADAGSSLTLLGWDPSGGARSIRQRPMFKGITKWREYFPVYTSQLFVQRILLHAPKSIYVI